MAGWWWLGIFYNESESKPTMRGRCCCRRMSCGWRGNRTGEERVANSSREERAREREERKQISPNETKTPSRFADFGFSLMHLLIRRSSLLAKREDRSSLSKKIQFDSEVQVGELRRVSSDDCPFLLPGSAKNRVPG